MYLFIFLSFYLLIFLPFYLSTFLSFYLSIFLPFYLSIFLPFYLAILLYCYLSMFQLFYLSIDLSFNSSILKIFLFFYLAIFVPYYLSTLLSFYLAIFLPIYCIYPPIYSIYLTIYLSFYLNYLRYSIFIKNRIARYKDLSKTVQCCIWSILYSNLKLNKKDISKVQVFYALILLLYKDPLSIIFADLGSLKKPRIRADPDLADPDLHHCFKVRITRLFRPGFSKTWVYSIKLSFKDTDLG